MKTKNYTVKALFMLSILLIPPGSVFAGKIRYVKQNASGNGDGSSWKNAGKNLQAALNASKSGDTVWVTAGTYYPAEIPAGSTGDNITNRDFAFYVPVGVKVYGGFAGTILGQGDGTQTYSFTEAAQLQTNAYYRVRQTDATGESVYSNSIAMAAGKVVSLAVYPNPVKNELNITSNKVLNAAVLDVSGKIIQVITLMPGTQKLNTSQWAPGLYILKTEKKETIKILKD